MNIYLLIAFVLLADTQKLSRLFNNEQYITSSQKKKDCT